jgi:hypothetical protein
MKNKKTIWLVVGFVVLAIISFYAGNQYANAKNKGASAQNTSSFARGGAGGQFSMRGSGGTVNGQVIAKDANSITVQLRALGGPSAGNATTGTTETGSKIVFYTSGTTVTKSTTGTINDVAIGSNVNVIGTANTDGSVNATTISIRPTEPNNPPTVPTN